MGAVESDEIGVEPIRQEAPRSLGSSDEHPACRSRELLQQALLRGDRRDEIGVPIAAAVACPMAATRGMLPRARRSSSRAPFGLVTTTQS